MNYEELFDLFVCNCGLPNDEIPQDNDEVYRYIKNAVTLYNQKTKKYRDILATPLKANELDETISCNSDNEFREDQEGLILVNLLKYTIFDNLSAEFIGLWHTSANETKTDSYKAQADEKRAMAKDSMNEAQRIIEDNVEDFTFI